MDINKEVKKLKNGGRVYLPSGEYNITEPVVIDTPCIKLEGEVWNYSSDPNGVFESDYGTKLRMRRKDIPAMLISEENVLGGNVVKDIGVQGDIKGMDTRGMFDFSNPVASAGLCFAGKRVDQAEFSKLSFCGLASAVCVTKNSQIDGCTFEKINTDGCCIGFYFAPGSAFYPIFRNNIVADTPSYGFFVNGEGINMHNLDINDFKFVRNGGAFPENNPYPKAAVCFYKVTNCSVRNSTFDMCGTFWYYPDDAKENGERQPSVQLTCGLWVEGDSNRIIGNTFSNSASDSIIIKGNSNVIMNNIVDKNIIVTGDDNILMNNVFTSVDAKIIISKNSKGTQLINVPKDKVVIEGEF